MAENPYAVDPRTGQPNHTSDYAPMQLDRYAVGANGWDSGDAPYNDRQGWAPSHRLGIGETVDSMRTGQTPVRWEGPDPKHPRGYYSRVDADDKTRHSAESIDSDGWQPLQGQPKRFAPNPRESVVANSRTTQSLAPTNYHFSRPFDQLNRQYWDVLVGSARRFNGLHFSMADHRRKYEVQGMVPVRSSRNTYRQEPTPWDVNLVDLPPVDSAISARFRDVSIPANPRSFRLGA